MRPRFAGLLVSALLFATSASAQSPDLQTTATVASPVPPLSRAELDQLLAPIALYPDALVAQILTSATYPLEVVEADRWLQQPRNAALRGDQLVAALTPQPWDPSVKSLVPFPRIIKMMDSRLDWTEQLGGAFLAQQADIMDAVQRLRQRAQAAGTLASMPHEAVTDDGEAITIEPAEPSVVYVPVYSPGAAYGGWPYPDEPPDWFPPDAGFAEDAEPFLWWSVDLDFPFWGWQRWDWHHHRLDVDPERYDRIDPRHPWAGGEAWQHDPNYRAGLSRGESTTLARPSPARLAAAPTTPVFRGYHENGARSGINRPGSAPAPVGKIPTVPAAVMPNRTVPRLVVPHGATLTAPRAADRVGAAQFQQGR